MPKPPGDAARRLLEAGASLARERGCGAVAVRETCRRARVNLGLFHYHFKSREAFLRRVLDEVYRDFFSRLTLSAEGGGTPPERLRRALRSIARFARERRRLLTGLLRDGMNGERQAAAFVAQNFPRHLPLMIALHEEGIRRGDFRRLPAPFFLSFCMGAINAPGILLTLLEDHRARRPLGRSLAALEDELLSDQAIEARLDMLLAALSTPRRRA
ncbi:MAG: TetR/AcrR family transcriptional regulator [Elusimicrobia bacterium]|nr:TetR/AcrR family transcriptional regulator [Elusimicrobiota bacterium]